MNQVELIGRLTKDPIYTITNEGKHMTKIIIAVDRISKKEEGHQNADFIPLTLWGNKAENTVQYTEKGSLVSVVAKLQSRVYETNGERKFNLDVIVKEIRFLTYKKNNNDMSDITIENNCPECLE